MKTIKRILALNLTLILIFSTLPITALAASGVLELGQLKRYTEEGNSTFTFTPTSNGLYQISLDGGTASCGNLYLYNSGNVAVEPLVDTSSDWDITDRTITVYLDAGETYTFEHYVMTSNPINYSIKVTSVDSPILTGSCGDTANYSLDIDTKSLSISGTGTVNFNPDFYYAPSYIESIDIANGITGLDYNCFYGLYNTSSISIPNTVTNIAYGAFASCESLTSIDIPSSVTSIGGSAFADCSSLTTVNFAGDAPTVRDVNAKLADWEGTLYPDASFDSSIVTLYYPATASGWTTPTWNGYNTQVEPGSKEMPNVGTVRYTGDTIYMSTEVSDVNSKLEKTGSTPGTLTLEVPSFSQVGTNDYVWIFTPTDDTTYQTATGTISLTVVERALQSISIGGTAPTKTSYEYGDLFDMAGLSVTATFDTGDTANVTDAVSVKYAAGDAMSVGDTSVTLEYTADGVTKSCLVSGLTTTKKTIDASAVAWDYTSAFTYDGTAKTVSLTNVPDGISVSYTDHNKTDAGTYTAKAALALATGYSDANYEITNGTVADQDWEIQKATYNGALPTLSYTIADATTGQKTVTIDEVSGAEYSFNGSTYTATAATTVDSNATVTLYIRIAESTNYFASNTVSQTIELTKQEQAAPGAFALEVANVDDTSYTVTIPAVDGAEYSFDGVTYSDAADANVQTGCIPGTTITGFVRLKADATHNPSPAMSANAVLPLFQVKTPVASPNGGKFSSSQRVTLTSATPGATIYYTLDGTNPTTASTEYTGSFSLSATTTVKAIAAMPNMSNSELLTVTFTKSSGDSGGSSSSGGSTATSKTENVANTDIATSGKQKIVENDDGSLTLPNGGKISIKDLITLDAPNGTVIDEDGTVYIPDDTTAKIELEDSGSSIIVPGGSAISTAGTVTVGDGTATLTLPNNAKMTLSEGSTINANTVKVGADGATVIADTKVYDYDEGEILVLDSDIPLGFYVMYQDHFSDVSDSAWYYNAVKYAFEKNIMQGTGYGFVPNTHLNRAMMVQILYNLDGSPSAGVPMFNDVASGAWYADAATWAASKSIVNGVGDNKFAPNNDITREQMAVMLYNYCNTKGIELPELRETTAFADSTSTSPWAIEAIEAMYQAGILSGKGNGVFDPQGKATRAEVAQMFMNFMEATK